MGTGSAPAIVLAALVTATMSVALPAQDSVLYIGGGRASPAAPARPSSRTTDDLPNFLTPDQCARLLHFRDHDLADATQLAVSRLQINSAAVADFRRLRQDLEHTYTMSQVAATRDVLTETARQTIESLRTAVKTAEVLSTPSGEAKSIGQIIKTIATSGAKEALQAAATGELTGVRDRLDAASRNLDKGIQELLSQLAFVKRMNAMREGIAEMDRIMKTTLPTIDSDIALYEHAVAEARRNLASSNQELRDIDTTLRTACSP
jgi:hypothetical protein